MVKIRLARVGRKKKPAYRIVITDSRSKRDGSFIDIVGHYDPLDKAKFCKMDKDKIIEWYKKGAQPTDTVLSLIKKQGIELA